METVPGAQTVGCNNGPRPRPRTRVALRLDIAKLLNLSVEMNEQEALLDAVLADLERQPHSMPALAKAGAFEYFYTHYGSLKSLHTTASSKEATSSAAITKAAFQEIADGQAAVSSAGVKVEHVAHGQLKASLKACKSVLRTMDASASDSKKLSAAPKAKAAKPGDADLPTFSTKRAAEVDTASSHFASFHDEFLTFVSESDLLDDATSDEDLTEETKAAAAFTAKAQEHLDCFKRIKSTIKP